MVARIICGKSIGRAVAYNEQKLRLGHAEFIHSANYLRDTEDLTARDRLITLRRRCALNERTQVNSVHISLNFDPSEALSKTELTRIADTYMQAIGFGQQPYLVYQHHDSGHPHVHIVTTNIQSDGTRIPLHNIGKERSESARLGIERDFKLVKAQRQAAHTQTLRPLKITYGKAETKRAMTNVLSGILPHYKYTSLPELNAVLRQYNVMADRGSETSRVYKRRGLYYRILNEKGEKIGVPIKASDFYFRPTLKYLEEKFSINEALRQQHKQRVRNAIDLSLIGRRGGITKLEKELAREQIHLIARVNDQGVMYGITFIDHYTKSVFNGSDLGKPYSARQLQMRCEPHLTVTIGLKQSTERTQLGVPEQNAVRLSLLKEILKADDQVSGVPAELREQPRKRKRKRLHL